MIYPNFLRAFQAAPKVTKNRKRTLFSESILLKKIWLNGGTCSGIKKFEGRNG